MKSKKILLATGLALALSFSAQAQLKVGNNPTTINANSVLEMESTNKGMLLPRVGLSATDNVAPLTAHVAGMVVYNTATAGSGATAVSPGYYYNDGSQWVRLAAGGNGGNVSLPVTNLVSNNSPAGNPGQIIYNNNPAVLPVGPVYWDGNNWVPLNPAASQPWYNQATNAAATSNTQNIYQMGNVGIGTTTPTQKLTIAGGGTGDVFGVENGSSFTAKNSAGAYESFLWPRWTDNVMYMNFGAGGFNIRNNASASTMFMTNSGNVGIGTTTPISKTHIAGTSNINSGLVLQGGDYGAGYGAMWVQGAGAVQNLFISGKRGNTGGNQTNDLTQNVVGANILLNHDGGNVGIGTTAPASKLEVNGAATNSSANVVTTATIDFAVSNLAATNNTGAAITLNNLKNGGAYTLVFTSTAASGTVAFTAPGFTIVEVGTVARTAGKKHIYNFVVIGTEVYVTMGTQN